MVIIKHTGGWSASNTAEIVTRNIPAERDDKGKPISFKIDKYISVTNPYTVSGVLSGMVQCAIKDDVSGEVYYFDGVYNNGRVSDLKDSKKKWINKI